MYQPLSFSFPRSKSRINQGFVCPYCVTWGHKKSSVPVLLCRSEKRRLCGSLFYFKILLIMLCGSIRRNLYARLAIHKMRWTPVFDYLFTPISTPKWHETIWFCMKFYKLAISKNLVTMRFYGLLLRYIDLWKKANLQQYLISFLLIPVWKTLLFKGSCLSLFSTLFLSYTLDTSA